MPVVGMVGGGQLARMTAAAAVGLGVTFRVLSESESESAALVTRDVTVGSHLSLPDVAAFAAECDVITFDHEHVPSQILAALESAGTLVRPGRGALRYTQDKLAMRQALQALPLFELTTNTELTPVRLYLIGLLLGLPGLGLDQ